MKTKKRFIQIRFYWYSLLTNIFDCNRFSTYKLKYGAMLLTLAVAGSCGEKTNNNSSEKPLPEKQDSTITSTFDSIKEQTDISSDTLPKQSKRKRIIEGDLRKHANDILVEDVVPIKFVESHTSCYVPIVHSSLLAQFPGGQDELVNFFSKNLKYPNADKKFEIEGVVVAQFVIDEKGKISTIKIIKSLSNNCDKEVIRVLSLMPKWIPAKQNERNVATSYTLPVRFGLKMTE